MKHLIAILCYIVGISAMSVDATVGAGLLIFLVGVLIHWKMWIIGTIAFFVGAAWNKNG